MHAENMHEMIPGIRPMLANADGNASAPDPIMVLARFENEDRMDAPGGFASARRRRRRMGPGVRVMVDVCAGGGAKAGEGVEAVEP